MQPGAVARAKSAPPLTSLRNVPADRYPLFLTAGQYLRLLDAATASPFLGRGEEQVNPEADPEDQVGD